MLVKTYGSTILGVEAITITVEVNIDRGVGYNLVGLPDNAIKESHHRVAAAITNNGYKIPGKKITINMAPADIRKEGSAYDLTIAIGILGASKQIDATDIHNYIIMGELSLDGLIRPIKGTLPVAIKTREEKFKGIFIPKENANEAAIVNNLEVYGVSNIKEVIDFFNKTTTLEKTTIDTRTLFAKTTHNFEYNFSDVKGQESVKRCLKIAAAGGHNIILIGPPGSGKTMLAKRLPSILPPMTLEEALETTKIYSVAGIKNNSGGLTTQRPFRAPHHTISDVALVGGGSYPLPGEISLSHNGVLFLDELPEFKKSVLEVMRQPLEDREITISRAKFNITYPSSLMLVASMNPSPSGDFLDSEQQIQSSQAEMIKYLNKISGPLLDRIDIHVEVSPVPFEKLTNDELSIDNETSEEIRKQVIQAREIQAERFKNIPNIHYNTQMNTPQIKKFCSINEASKDILKIAMDRLNLSARAYDRILKVARTVADLENSETIQTHHIAETIQYRSLDRNKWMR